MTAFPDHPFWDFSLALYARSGVSDACLALQDDYGVDVNLVLFCTWSAAAGPGALDPGDIQACLSATRSWQEKAIQPIRAVRRYCSQPDSLADDAIRASVRQSILSAELDAEHVEQLILAGLADAAKVGSSSDAPPRTIAAQNLATYLDQLQVERSPVVTAHLDVILEAGFGPVSDP